MLERVKINNLCLTANEFNPKLSMQIWNHIPKLHGRFRRPRLNPKSTYIKKGEDDISGENGMWVPRFFISYMVIIISILISSNPVEALRSSFQEDEDKANAQEVDPQAVGDLILALNKAGWDSKWGKAGEALKRSMKTSNYLYIRTSNLEMLPPEIGTIPQIKRILASRNKIKSLPAEISKLVNLKELNVRRNKLTGIPTEIGGLHNLQEIDFSDNQLQTIPMEIGNLHEMKYLELNDNRLLTIPYEIGKLSNLVELNLSNNQLKSLPCDIGELTRLKNLFAANNQLESLPCNISHLKSLLWIDLSNNKLQTVPRELEQLQNIKWINLEGNPLSEHGNSNTTWGREELKAHFGDKVHLD